MQEKQSLGQILIGKGLVTPEKINQALRIQTGSSRRLGQILIQMELITEEQLFSALSDQHGIEVADIAGGIPEQALRLLPRHLCKKYSALPINVEENNVLALAMVNPLDQAARTEIEAYTGMVVKPCLARQQAVSQAIREQVPATARDFFHPLIYSRRARIVCAVVLVMAVALGVFAHREIQREKYGVISRDGDLRVFSNHEMLIGVEGQGAISLIGHGPYAKGFYSVVFDTKKELLAFVEKKRDMLSDAQYEWIQWVVEEKLEFRN
ncbi:MAG: hypothetical protein R6X08_02135 [Desulfosalsimonadaceae bacterium]